MERVLILILSSLVFLNCQQENSKGKHAFSSPYWEASHPVTFNLEVSDTLVDFSVVLELEHNKQYTFSNLFLFTELVGPDNLSQVDTLEYQMAYNDGSFLGVGNNSKKIQLVYADGIRFDKKGTYTLSIRHGMREDSLKGIQALSYYLTKK